MLTTSTIPAGAVHTALVAAKIRLARQHLQNDRQMLTIDALSRVAAYTADPAHLHNCDEARRYRCQSFGPVRPAVVPMHRGDMKKLADRTALFKGPAEVRKTWGCGIRALRAELQASYGMR